MTGTVAPATGASASSAQSTDFGGRIQGDHLDSAVIREDFPILGTESHGRPLVFLDSASTSQKPQVVIDAVEGYYREYTVRTPGARNRGALTLTA